MRPFIPRRYASLVPTLYLLNATPRSLPRLLKPRPYTTSPPSTPPPRDRSVGCLIIGDEILGGKTLDTNSNYLAKKCFETGLELRKVEVIPDTESDIISSVRSLSSSFGTVFTSGGIGPTHDDITYQSIANAFGLRLELHQETIRKMEERILNQKPTPEKPVPLTKLTEAHLRMAALPTGPGTSVSFPGEGLWVPVATVNGNVHILPGISRLFKTLVDGYFERVLLPSLSKREGGFVRVQIGTHRVESQIADVLTAVQKEVDSKGIKVGSYPRVKVRDEDPELPYRVCVSVVGRDKEEVEKVADRLREEIEGFEVKDGE
ncbi:hypothetical protein HDV05_005865 [Chytridiales sp. JEL 0842]|nr:hypothetical protein HDV05_005865 [Chytridiales sp. JEL 0842]